MKVIPRSEKENSSLVCTTRPQGARSADTTLRPPTLTRNLLNLMGSGAKPMPQIYFYPLQADQSQN